MNDQRRDQLYRLLGDLPPETEVTAKFVAIEERDTYILEKLTLQLNGLEPVPAYFTKPKAGKAPYPAVLFNHSHGGKYHLGKDELLDGNDYMQNPPYAEALAAKGYASLCIDAWGFGERRGRTESEIFKHMLWNGQVMWGMMVYDNIQAVDYLISRPEVDSARIGTLGMSMGSTMAWWTAALDPRIHVCADICCLTDFDALIDSRGLDGHGVYYYVPGLLKHFTAAQINGLIAPRPHISLAGIYDTMTPPAGLDRIEAELNRVYAEQGAPEAWKLLRYPVGHTETAEMRADLMAFLTEHL
jgi:dienelactone hydrolase